jgi:hypothetical protein
LPRRPGPGAASEEWSTDRVRVEAYATIIAAIWYANHAGLRIHVALSHAMSSIRYDLSDEFVMITNESGRARALCVHNAGHAGGFFQSVHFELRTSHEQAKQLDISGATLPQSVIRAADVRNALQAVTGLQPDPAFLTDTRCDDIGLRAISEEHAAELGFARGGARNPYP